MAWTHAGGTQLSLTKAIRSADEPPTSKLQTLRQQHRARALAEHAAIISVEPRASAFGTIVEVITKHERPPGYGFAGVLSVSSGRDEYTVRIAENETFTGRREAVVNTQQWSLGELQIPDVANASGGTPIKGWFQDPYDSTYDEDALNSPSDDVRLDPAFPDHPLTKIRAALANVCASLEIHESSVGPQGPITIPLEPSLGPRRCLTTAVLREVYWTLGRNDLLEKELLAELQSVDPRGTSEEPDVARLLVMLGIVQHNSDHVLFARATLERACKMFESTSGSNHRDVAVALINLGRAQRALTQFREARHSFDRAIAILDQDPGAAGVHLLSAVSLQCDVLAKLGLLTRGDPIMERAQRLQQADPNRGLRTLRELAGGPPTYGKARIVVVPDPKKR